MTGEELFKEYCRREKLDLPWESVAPHSVWVWEQAAKYAGEFCGSDPRKNIRQLKAGEEL